jgi:hypothetical protein
MRDNYYYILSVGAGDLEQLLLYKNAIAYSTRVEGWACDYYDFDGVLISTGYSPLKEKNTVYNYVQIREYNQKAYEINSSSRPYKEREIAVNELLSEFINSVKKE